MRAVGRILESEERGPCLGCSISLGIQGTLIVFFAPGGGCVTISELFVDGCPRLISLTGPRSVWMRQERGATSCYTGPCCVHVPLSICPLASSRAAVAQTCNMSLAPLSCLFFYFTFFISLAYVTFTAPFGFSRWSCMGRLV